MTFGPSTRATWHAVVTGPAVTVAIFALLLNFPWEMLQAPLYAGMASLAHAEATRACLQATIGDMVIMLIAHAVVATGLRNRRWMVTANGAQVSLFIVIGVSITVFIEWLDLAPVLQWLVLPLLTVWFGRRQLAGASMR